LKPTEFVYCVPAELRGQTVDMDVVARTQNDCGVISLFVDDLSWDMTSPSCEDLNPPT
jgi:hypothetical protein